MKKTMKKLIMRPFRWIFYAIDVIEFFIVMEVVKWFMGYKTMVALEMAVLGEVIRYLVAREY